MPSSPSLFVIGSLVVACTARLDRIPGAGETVRADDFMIELGGKGFNVAVAALRQGATIDGLFAVGSDAAGDFARDAFVHAGLDPALLLTLPGKTGAGIGLIEPGGENRIAVHPGANDGLGVDHAEAAATRIAQANMVIGQFEASDAAIAAAFAVARKAGVPTLLNPSPYRSITPEILGTTDILVVNRSEAQALAVHTDCEWTDVHIDEAEAILARRLLKSGPRMIVVTAGQRGATLYELAGSLFQPAFQIEAIDTIGAGDAFIGSFAVALAAQEDKAVALLRGSGAGAIAAMHFGLLGSLPSLERLRDFLETS